jgi:curli biogenesis system outer membrane secretion channel CsgG
MRRALLTWIITGSLGAGICAAQKRSVTVQEFDYSAVETTSQAIFGTHVNIGRGIGAMMVQRMAQSNRFTVVERQKIQTVMKEQDFGASGRVKKGTQARIGQIRGAELTLLGDIVVFGRDDRRIVGVGGAATGGGAGIGGGYKKTGKAVVVVNYRLVDNESSEIVATGEARGESQRSSAGGFLALLTGGVLAGGAIDMSSRNFAETIIGEATMDCVNRLAQQLESQSGVVNSQQRTFEIDARVADVNGSTVIINAGLGSGVKVGDRLKISRIRKEIKDPQTGEVLDVAMDDIGDLVITQVKDRIAIGAFTGSQEAKVGDVARN